MAPSKRSKGLKDPKYLEWIRQFSCVVCWLMGTGEWEAFVSEPWDVYGWASEQHSATEAAHVGDRGLSQKCSDRETIPLCGHEHHREGKESAHKLQKRFWGHHGIDRNELILHLNARYESEKAA